MSAGKQNRIAELNDQLRKRLGVPVFGLSVPGTILMTYGIMALEPEQVINVCAKFATKITLPRIMILTVNMTLEALILRT